MIFSFATVYTTIIISNLLLILIACLLSNKKFLLHVGYSTLGAVLLLICVRLFLPLEFSFTTTVHIPEVFSNVLIYLSRYWFYIGGFPVSVWTLFSVIWGIGILFKGIHFLRVLRFTYRYPRLYGIELTETEPYQSILEDICATHKRKNSFRIYRLENISAPVIQGILHPCILIPAHLELSQRQLYFILSHEAAHHFHFDMGLKYIVKLLSILYWWNPACHILEHYVEDMLELRIDARLTKRNPRVCAEYLECLLHLAKQPQCPFSYPDCVSVAFYQRDCKALEMRFRMLTSPTRSSSVISWLCKLALVFATAGALSFSYLYIYEIYYVAPPEGYFVLSDENAYVIQLDDNIYDIYFNGIKIETVSSLDNYPKDIPIYYSLEEVTK